MKKELQEKPSGNLDFVRQHKNLSAFEVENEIVALLYIKIINLHYILVSSR